MNRCALAVLVCLLFASISFAQQSAADAPASREDIEKYLDMMHARDLAVSTMNAMTKQMHQMIHAQLEKQPNLPPDFEARMDQSMDDMIKEFPVDEMIQAMVPAYQRHLTKGDVEALTAFYSTPTGQKVLKEMPAMTADAMQSASGVIQKMMAKMQERLQSEMAELQKGSEGNSKPQSSPN
ncbi:MAG: DUF2059 domain-containing protein [Candidatus Acidiferrales bacterium]|jgi:uncharacterized protein